MQMTISIHQTPKEIFDALPLEVEEPISDSPTRWKTLDVSKDVSITFFKTKDNEPVCQCANDETHKLAYVARSCTAIRG